MKILTVTSLFPSRAMPTRGVFVQQRVRAMAARGHDVRVVAPVPWVPPGPMPSHFARWRAVPERDSIDGIDVRYPRYAMAPGVGMYFQHRSYAGALRRELGRLPAHDRPDVIDAHFLFPDCAAAGRVAGEAGIPWLASARGSDVKVLGRIPYVARRIREALARATGVVAVSRDLARHMKELGLFDGHIDVIPNGVDPARFHPRPRGSARAELGLPADRRFVICVGHLSPEHGQALLLEAVAHPSAPPDLHVHLVGGGADRDELLALAGRLGIADRVHLEGPVPHGRIPLWFAAADGAALLSTRAGSPNAVLEALACGTPCLVSDLPEMREALEDLPGGELVRRDAEAAARGLHRLLAADDAARAGGSAVRTWEDVADEVEQCLQRITRGEGSRVGR